MQITRIEVFGFKSFMDRLIMPLKPGITTVVGPNGCGKSNVVDALRWVLGETRARSLRGGSLEDVIFNGTDALRPLGLAEVSITLRSSEQDFFADLVSPSLEAELIAQAVADQFASDEEESETDLSGVQDPSEPAQAVETTESESELAAKADRPHLTVIKGKLDSGDAEGETTEGETESVETELSPNTEQSSQEDATSTPQASNTESPGSSSPDSAADSTLVHKFSWLKSVNEVQVTRRLYRSGESEYFINRVPCRLRDLKELFRAVGLGARAYAIVAQGEVSRIITSKPDERRQLLEDAAGVAGFRDRIASARRRLKDTDVNISRLQDIIKEVSRQVGSLKRQASKAQNRARLKAEIAECERSLFIDKLVEHQRAEKALDEQITEARNSESGLVATLQREQAEETSARGELMTIDVEGDRLRALVDSIKEELGNRERQRSQKRSRINELRAFIAAKEQSIGQAQARMEVLQQRIGESDRELQELTTQAEDLQRSLAEADAGTTDALEAVRVELQDARAALREAEGELRKLREERVSLESRLRSVEEQLIAASPLSQLRRAVSGDRAGEISKVVGELSVLLDGIAFPGELAQAVEAVAAERAGFLVADDPYLVARSLSTAVREERGEGSEGFGIGVFRRAVAQDSGPVTVGALPRLLDRLTVQSGFERAAQLVFANVFVAPSLESALAFFEEDGATNVRDAVVVTHNGEIVSADSFYSVSHSAGIVQLKARCTELTTRLSQLTESAEQAQALRDQHAKCTTELEQRQAELLIEHQAKQQAIRQLGNSLGSVRGRLEAGKRLRDQTLSDLDAMQLQIKDAQTKIEEFRREDEAVHVELRSLETEDDSELRTQLQSLQGEYERLDDVRRERRKQLAAVAETVSSTRAELDKARSRVSVLMLDQQRRELDRSHVRERIESDYGSDVLAELLALVADPEAAGIKPLSVEERTGMRENVQKLKTRISREGDVDPESIERLEVEEQRLRELEEQQADLQQAAKTLRETIDRLVATSEQRFMSTFEAVKENYSKLIPRLFGGGRGSLELTDTANPLEAGLEIIARPPGKKLKSIELLSGGEKALCATALIFAMFMERPSPLCVLDEVDAPLDDANLARFLSMIKEMSCKTQFLMITHNKQSMAVGDTLVGVTMEQPGASKFISVSLQEAYEQVA